MLRSATGRITLKALFSLAFLAALIFVAFKVLPVYVNDYQLSDYIRTQTPFWLAQRASADTIQTNIMAKADDLDLTLQKDEVMVEANPERVHVNIDYNVPVDLKVYTLRLHFSDSSDNRAIR